MIKRVELSEFINTDFEKLKRESRYPVGGVNPHLAVLAQAVLAKYPQWQLVASNANQHYSDTSVDPHVNKVVVTRFKIMEKREELGYIGWDYSYSRGDQYVVGNDRISAQMERTSHIKTTKIDIAMRHIKKHFSPKTVDEHFSKATNETTDNLYRAVQTMHYSARNTYTELSNEIADFVGAKWDEFVATLAPAKESTAAKYLEIQTKMKSVTSIQEACVKKLSHDILIRGNEYVIRHNGVVSIFDNEHLPQEIKMKLGMLKLVEVGQVFEGVGYRGTEDCFIVV